jgi:hypothetical protein
MHWQHTRTSLFDRTDSYARARAQTHSEENLFQETLNIGGQNPAKLDQTNEKVCIGLGGLGDSNF